MSVEAPTHRVLVIDDNAKIHLDFVKILMPCESEASLDLEEEDLFGPSSTTNSGGPCFDVDCALSGEQGVGLVESSLETNTPFAVAFVDIRMPSAWDGIKTTVELWRRDPRVQVVLCTAYADYSWEDLRAQLGDNDHFLILKKPFDAIEVRQIAAALAHKWELLREQETQLSRLEATVRERTIELANANEQLRKEMQQREVAQKELRSAQKLEALGRMAAGVAHEINNPLAFIIGNLELCAAELKRSSRGEPSLPLDELSEALEDAMVGAERIRRIVQSVRAISRPREEPTADVNVGEAVSSVLRMLSADARFGAEVSVASSVDNLPPVVAERHGLEQVLTNILMNAAQALPPNCGEPIRITSRRTGQRVILKITDRGHGIAAEQLEKIFDPFFTTRAQGDGTGLGLSICRTLVDSFGGSLSIESTVGQGTSVLLELQSTEASYHASASSNRPPVKQVGADQPRILIVDDEKLILRNVARLLAPRHTTTASSAAEALALYGDGSQFDVVLCDVMMPEMTGFELFGEIEKLGPEHAARVIFMTGGTLESVSHQRGAVSSRPCVEKPIRADALRRLIDEIAAEVRPRQPRVMSAPNAVASSPPG